MRAAAVVAAAVAPLSLLLLTAPRSASASTCPSLGTNPTNAAFTTAFFSASCYNLVASGGDAPGAGSCVASALSLPTCSGCFAAAGSCVVSACAECNRGATKTSACLQCASTNCAVSLRTCTGAAAAVSPTSNLFLGSGFFDYAGAMRVGFRFGLASDVGGAVPRSSTS